MPITRKQTTAKPAKPVKPLKPAKPRRPMKVESAAAEKPQKAAKTGAAQRDSGTPPHVRSTRSAAKPAVMMPSDNPNPSAAAAAEEAARRRRARPGVTLTAEQRDAAQTLFLESFRKLGIVSYACRAAGISRTTLYRWLEHDEAFSILYRQAEADAVDALEGEAYRRGVFGVEKIVVSMGKVVYGENGKPVTEKTYSDVLLLNLMRAHSPKFRERSSVDVTSGGEKLATVADLIANLAATQKGRKRANDALDDFTEGANS